MKDINYNEIDELCRPMVKFFNNINLRTKFSCQGHNNNYNSNFYIMFHEDVTDEQIANFLSGYENIFHHSPFMGKFVKWMRLCNGQMITNWMYNVEFGQCKTSQLHAQKDLKIFEKIENNT